MLLTRLLGFSLIAGILAQNIGKQTKEQQPKFSVQKCSNSNGCSPEPGTLTMDSNWRWTHKVGDWKPNCYDGNWSKELCPDPETCTKNCAIDGIDGYDTTYGVKASDDGVQLNFVTKGTSGGSNVGSRVYLLDGQKYKQFSLVNQEFSLDIDMSKLGCGINGAVYFVEMPEDGGMSKFPTNKAGAYYGTGYCDGQCPVDIKWINGEANLPDPTSGKTTGKYGTCCSEMDIWEANKMAAAYTPHPSNTTGRTRCEGEVCNSTTDKAGCDFNSYRLGNKTYLGPGMVLDTTKKFTVVTQFISSTGTNDGDLVEIKRLYVQDGKVIPNSMSNIPGGVQSSSLTDDFCAAQKSVFQDENVFKAMGGLKNMGESLKRGMTLVMSVWDDSSVYMLWLDSNFPTDKDPSSPGVARGPCSVDSGRPADVEKEQADAFVVYSNIKYGEIGSTYPH